MKPKEEAASRYSDETIKLKFISRILNPIKTNGFEQMRMDDIAKHMDLSKATLYKYFSSKDEVIQRLVENFIAYIIEADKELTDGSGSFIAGFQKSFSQTLLIANYGTDVFYNDLNEVYPELFGRIQVAVGERNGRLKELYEKGAEAAVFNKLNASLMIIQDELMFRNLLDSLYLMKHQLTLRGAIFDYYQIKKLQLLSSQAFIGADDTAMNEKLEYLVRKVTYGVG
ncbi:TetR/AcrR family transcriptional regulator [Bacillus sp. FJAT-26390]|uniref:TetR/AcrR family transcriptional regulator n=1 Tax=Bacillus sp. FJAT-26390 TaxID=1743142 RepID=UPI0009E1EF89|nr:TetR/AcrR family transcriptional regulator [Bacillus sp. FJAT-26390]